MFPKQVLTSNGQADIINVSDSHNVVHLKNGALHVFANPTVFSAIESGAWNMAENNFLIP